jgi:hypothetical protein
VSIFSHTRAAVVHTLATLYDTLPVDANSFPLMAWAPDYMLFATATMFTLIFVGNNYALKRNMDGNPVQERLQMHTSPTRAGSGARGGPVSRTCGSRTGCRPGAQYGPRRCSGRTAWRALAGRAGELPDALPAAAVGALRAHYTHCNRPPKLACPVGDRAPGAVKSAPANGGGGGPDQLGQKA